MRGTVLRIIPPNQSLVQVVRSTTITRGIPCVNGYPCGGKRRREQLVASVWHITGPET